MQGLTDPTDFSADTVQTAYATVSLSSSKGIAVEAGTLSFGTASNFTRLGFEANKYGSDEGGLKVADIDLSTQEGAVAALDAIDEALNSINLDRANLGAVQNRLEATVNNLTSNSHQPRLVAVADRRCRFLGGNDQPRQVAGAQPGGAGDAGPGQPVAAAGAAAPPLTGPAGGPKEGRFRKEPPFSILGLHHALRWHG